MKKERAEGKILIMVCGNEMRGMAMVKFSEFADLALFRLTYIRLRFSSGEYNNLRRRPVSVCAYARGMEKVENAC